MYFILPSQEIVLLNQYHKCGSRKKVIFPGIQNNLSLLKDHKLPTDSFVQVVCRPCCING